MDQSAVITEDTKNSIYNQLADAMIAALETNTLSHDDSQISSKYILDNLDNAKTHGELLTFLEEASNKWPAYKGVYLAFEEQKTKTEDSTQLEEAREKLE